MGHALRIVEALARQPHEYQGQIVALLSEPRFMTFATMPANGCNH